MSFHENTPAEQAVIDQLAARWRDLATSLRATVDQLDRQLEEFGVLSERSSWVWRRCTIFAGTDKADESYEQWCGLVGLDQVDAMLCDIAARINAT